MSYLFVAATVPKMGERDVTACCSANDTIVKVREVGSTHTYARGREHAHIRTHTTHTQSHWCDAGRHTSGAFSTPRLA